MKQRNTDIDWIRAILIILMILIHIVSFGNAYPQLKAGILSFMMPTFLIITGYLVNIEKSPKEMGRYLMCLALPYVIMVTGFSVLSYFMPVRDGITELSLSQICEKIFVTSIGPFWFMPLGKQISLPWSTIFPTGEITAAVPQSPHSAKSPSSSK